MQLIAPGRNRVSQNRAIRRRAATYAIAAALLLGTSAAAQALEPATGRETAAINARVLQTEMMVAALSCGLKQQYNKVVKRYQASLIGHGRVLRQMYRNAYGASAQQRLDRYITKLANHASSRSNADRAGFCSVASVLFRDALAESGNLDMLTNRLVQEAVLPGLAR